MNGFARATLYAKSYLTNNPSIPTVTQFKLRMVTTYLVAPFPRISLAWLPWHFCRLVCIHIFDCPSTKWSQTNSNHLTFHAGRNNLNNNNLPFPIQLTSLTNLVRMHVGGNGFVGTIPTEIFQMTQLKVFNTAESKWNSGIPNEIQQLTALTTLMVHNSLMTGTIPTVLGTLSQLTYLSIANNNLVGKSNIMHLCCFHGNSTKANIIPCLTHARNVANRNWIPAGSQSALYSFASQPWHYFSNRVC